MPTSVNGAQLTRLIDNSGHTLNVDSAGNLATVPAGPAGAKFYTHALADVAGVVAANNYLSLFNPSGSGKTMVLYQLIVAPYATGATTATASLNAFRTTAASGGTLVAASTVNRFVTADPDPVVEVRTGNPAATTVGATLIGTPPAVTAAAGGASATVAATPSGASFVIVPGQGVVFRTALGNVNQLWNINITWAEF